MPHDGQAPQDGEPRAGHRWRQPHAVGVAPQPGPVRGAALDRTPPLGALALAQGGHGRLGCQPDAPPTLDERGAWWHANDGRAACASRPGQGRCTAVSMERARHDGRWRDGTEV